MTYIADSIGTEYEQWKGGDVVFISSPTGSGKTTFILNVFLPFLVKTGQKMLYLVNRTVLKEQLYEEVNNLPIDLSNNITIGLYQSIEKECAEGKDKSFFEWKYGKYDCVVCDEAHYFLMDSNYNTNTILSYKFVNNFFCNRKRVYMSATIEHVEKIIRHDIEKEKYIQSYWTGCHSNRVNASSLLRSSRIFNYKAERHYEHIKIGILKSRDEIKSLVVNGSEKWLIFVDSKIYGKKLMQDILDAFRAMSKAESVKFITSDYDLDEEAADVVETIITEGKQEPKVLIATSVLDNGINIKDIELRNIIIVADTEVEFIQMLGRKRNDGNPIKLYIYRHDRNHFLKRKRIIGQRQRIAVECYKAINNRINTCGCDTEEICNQKEMEAIYYQHQIWLKKLMNNEVSFDNIKAIFFAVNGVLVLNMLSLRNIENLNQYYVELLKKFDKHEEDAFLREQLSWLGKTEDEIERLLSDAYKDKYELSREKVINELGAVCDMTMSREEFIALKNRIATDLEELVEYVGKEHSDYKKYIDLCKKNERAISDKFMDYLRVNCNIPFAVKRGSYTITRATE